MPVKKITQVTKTRPIRVRLLIKQKRDNNLIICRIKDMADATLTTALNEYVQLWYR